MTTTVLFAGGGTAGHVFPAIAAARALADLGDYEPVFLGTAGRLEARLVPEAGFAFEIIDAMPLPRKLSTGLLKLPLGLRRAIGQVTDLIERHEPAAAASFGGYVSFPLSRAAWVRDVPLLLHEQNAIPGLSNQLAARWASSVAVTFPSSSPWFRAARSQVVTGNPVRGEILDLDLVAARPRAHASFDLDPDQPCVLVFGGSQGARSLNRAVAGAAREFRDLGVQVIHVAGTKLHAETIELWRHEVGDDPDNGPRLRILDFVDDMGLAYAAADVVVCRAGATTIAELTALGLPSVLVPYPAATRDHQMANARALASVGGAKVVAEDDLDTTSLVAAVRFWLADPVARKAAGTAAAAFGRRDASRLVAAAISDLVRPPAMVPGGVGDVRRHGGAQLPGIDDDEFEAAFAKGSESNAQVRNAMIAAMDDNIGADDKAWDELRKPGAGGEVAGPTTARPDDARPGAPIDPESEGDSPIGSESAGDDASETDSTSDPAVDLPADDDPGESTERLFDDKAR